MKIKGWELDFFNSGEWQVCDERLKDLEKVARRAGSDGYLPGRASLFKSLRLLPMGNVRVAIIGQDPYPAKEFATGVAFSVPSEIQADKFPPTLKTLLKEYSTDLRLPLPSSGNLDEWSKDRGVLLWNAVPSCLPGRSLSHDWVEWDCLTREIIRTLCVRGVVFALIGQVARRFIGDINLANNSVIVTSHPSPRGQINSKTPFLGSRLFSTINDKLANNAQEVIDWRLP